MTTKINDDKQYLIATEMAPVKEFLLSALTMKDKGVLFHYEHLVQQINVRDDPETLWRVYIGLGSCVSNFTSKPNEYRDLIHGLYSYTWNQELKVTVAFIQLLIIMVTANVTFFLPTLQLLVKSLLITPNGSVSDLNVIENYGRNHRAILTLIQLVPTGLSELFPVLEESFPHKRFSQQTQCQYVIHLLHICDYLPIMQAKILDLIIGKCLEIDVEIVIEDSGEVKIVEEYDGENEDDMFQLDDDQGEFSTNNNNNNNNNRQVNRGKIEDYYRIPLEVVEMADKLDAILVLVIQYIDNIISPNSTKSKEIRDKFYQQLLSVFEVRILTTYKSKFVQYLIFFTAAKDENFAFIFLKWLLRIFFDDKNQSHIKRQSAVVYIASFLSRANYISSQVVFDILSELLAWANSYVISTGAISHSLNIDGSIIDVDVYKNDQKYYQHVDQIEVLLPQENSLSIHETFYCCVQAVCYILCFHGKEMALLQRNNDIMRNYWEVIITSIHFPLRYCLQSVRLEFLRLSLNIDLFREEYLKLIPFDILQTGALEFGDNVRMGTGSNPLDSFFPFDPCLLIQLHHKIEDNYRLWRGLSGLDLLLEDEIEIESDAGSCYGSLKEGYTSSLSSAMSSIAYTHGTEITMMGASLKDESMSVSASNGSLTHRYQSSTRSNSHYESDENSLHYHTMNEDKYKLVGDKNDRDIDDDNGNGWTRVQNNRRPRQFSIGSVGSW